MTAGDYPEREYDDRVIEGVFDSPGNTTDTTLLYKWLNGRAATHVPDFKYRLGAWTKPVEGPLVACENGYHLMRPADVAYWISRDLFVAEHDGELVEDKNKVVCRKVRIVEHLTGWNDRTARLFAADCAERVLPLFEAQYPNDDRPRRAIEAARLFANGEIDAAARDAAEAAARAAAGEWQSNRLLDYAHGRNT